MSLPFGTTLRHGAQNPGPTHGETETVARSPQEQGATRMPAWGEQGF